MQEWMLSFVGSYGYLGIFALIFIENVFPPIPSEAVLLFGGALTVSTAMNVPGTVVAATFGSLAGAIVLYALGRVFQADRLRRLFAGRFGEVTHLKPEYVDLAESWFSRYEAKAVLICRCIPVVRSLISIPAGFSKMPMGRFLLLTALGSTVWNTVLVSLGAGLGTAEKQRLTLFALYGGAHHIVACLQRNGLADRHRRLVGAPPVKHGDIAAVRVLAIDDGLGFRFATPVRGRACPGAVPAPDILVEAAILQQVNGIFLSRRSRGKDQQHGQGQQGAENTPDAKIFFHRFHLFIKRGAAARQSVRSGPLPDSFCAKRGAPANNQPLSAPEVMPST